MPSLADPRFGPHCDRLSGTTASFCADVELPHGQPRKAQGAALNASSPRKVLPERRWYSPPR